ncbi:tyrosine-type recombinase/integrase, partial [bacterium]|nr:tyrosine-type recombinase/integrase [bacterium]
YKEYSSEDLGILFGRHYTERMATPDWYWLPLISLYSGSRIGEVANLAVNNFIVVDGIKVFEIGKGKTPGSRRSVPIHSALLGLGLWEYVEFLKSKGEARFIWFRPLKTPGKSTGEEWAKWVDRCGITDDSKTFHSFRSTAITEMYNGDSPNPAAIRDSVGHTGGTQGAHGLYMRAVLLKRVHEMIESVGYPTVPLDELRRDDPTFSDFYGKEKAWLTSPKFAAQQEARKRHAALQADREIRVAKRDKKKSR